MRPILTITLNPAFDMHYFMEHFDAGKENYVQKALCNAGGKGINISRALTVNGIKNTAYVVLGEENSSAFEAQLLREGITYIPFYTAGRIRENITLHPADSSETRISLDTFCADASVLDRIEGQITENVNGEYWLAFAGRLPRGINKEDAISFLQRQAKAGARIIVDSNSFTLADIRQIHPWFIKPNEQEISAFLGRSVSDMRETANVAYEWVNDGIAKEIMVSLGERGAVWSNGSRKLLLSVPALGHPASTIGAGDSTLAGLLAANARGSSIDECLCNAVAYGTAACMTEGTLPPLPEDIEHILPQIHLTELSI